MRRRASHSQRPASAQASWYKDAVIYEVRVRSFYDADGDGLGDFQGLAAKLDYLQDLGVTALWLLPTYPSPLRDDGYDISDYTDVHEQVGTLADFKLLLKEAHRRGLKVITELVLNHTSDQHPWFQRARRAPPGSPLRDFYVWSDSAERYKDARIIFKDFEPSNWAWDPVAKAYFWHRFYSHQPDLNFENPQVHKAMLSVLDFWFKLGVDGLRLDAVPYLYEAEGTNCENLPATHDFLRKLRAHVDATYPNRLLLAEANQWPEDAVAYFGSGDECHMAFHFPIMPRLFMSIHMEDRFPIMDILAQTPAVPESCQWALFLRNHDELTLEMVTDEERDYMYRAYAHEPTMRINLGIRRRLAPLVGNDRRKLELMNGLLFSLPGTPVLYYGDEIGMGDNHYLGDRNGVRTPMQWSADRNAGFSRANPQRLILPIIIDPEYHYESINVEAQQNNPNSLLWWTKRLIALRKRFQAFGRGTFDMLLADNPRVLAFCRKYAEETILVVANLSRFVQYVRFDLSQYKGLTPIELFGRTRFPVIEDAPYMLTLGGHAFYWFSIEPPKAASLAARADSYAPPMLDVSTWEPTLAGDGRTLLEEVLPNWLPTRPWFDDPDRPIAKVRIVEVMPVAQDAGGALELAIAEVEFTSGPPEKYLLPIGLAPGERAGEVLSRAPQATIAHARVILDNEPLAETGARRSLTDVGALIYDAVLDPPSCHALLDVVVRRRRWKASTGEVTASTLAGIAPTRGPAVRVLRPESERPVLVFSDELVLKLFRRLDDGSSPDLEIGRFRAGRPEGPKAELIGAIEQRGAAGRGDPVTLGILERFVQSESDAWAHARNELSRYYERVLVGTPSEPIDVPLQANPLELAGRAPPRAVREAAGNYLDWALLLGRRTAEMHASLVSADDAAFAPEAYTALDQRSVYQSMRNLTGKVMAALRNALPSLPQDAAVEGATLLDAEARLLDRFERLLERKLGAMRTRCHGNLHLQQALFTGKDFVIIDFEGDRSRPLSERRRKRSPLQDVASMLRSYHYASMTTLLNLGVVRETDRDTALPWAEAWHLWSGAAFVSGWLEAAGDSVFVPKEREEVSLLLDFFVLERALIELGSELHRRQDRAVIPLRRLTQLLWEPPTPVPM